MSPNISVLITSFNQKSYICEAIQSVIEQTMKPFEIIVADDCSTDGSQEIIKKFELEYPNLIRAFYNKRNIGRPKNKNFAQKQIRGDLITWLDGDDRFLPEKLEKEYMALKRNQTAKIIYSNFFHIDKNGQRIGLWADGRVLPSGYVFKEVFGLEIPTCFFRNELTYYNCLQKLNFYDPYLEMYGDWDLRIRLTKRYNAVYNSEPLSEYRIHPLGISRSPTLKHIAWVKYIYQKNRILLNNLPKSDKIFIENGLKNYLALLCFNAARQEIKNRNNKLALKYWFKHIQYRPKSLMNLRFTARVILSESLRNRLKLLLTK